MDRLINFSAGPSNLPVEVLEEAAKDMVNYKGMGMSVTEMSHRSAMYQEIFDETEKNLRELMNIPDNYKVLFLQGGASLQFAMIPMNLLGKHNRGDFIVTGVWSKKALKETKMMADARVIASSEDVTFSALPKIPSEMPKDTDFIHITSNNTIYGTNFTEFPETGNIPLIGDFSSNILSEPVDVKKFGMIYAGAQKNLGPAGLTIVIIREDLIGKHKESVPTMLRYQTHADAASMFNTPPCYSIYIAGLVLKWIKKLGGVEAIAEMNRRKSAKLYDFLDSSKLFSSTVKGEARSLMNVPFVTGDADKDKAFIAQAIKGGFVNLKGHRSVGGMRASIYNAMPEEGIEKLISFMKEFEKNNS